MVCHAHEGVRSFQAILHLGRCWPEMWQQKSLWNLSHSATSYWVLSSWVDNSWVSPKQLEMPGYPESWHLAIHVLLWREAMQWSWHRLTVWHIDHASKFLFWRMKMDLTQLTCVFEGFWKVFSLLLAACLIVLWFFPKNPTPPKLRDVNFVCRIMRSFAGQKCRTWIPEFFSKLDQPHGRHEIHQRDSQMHVLLHHKCRFHVSFLLLSVLFPRPWLSPASFLCQAHQMIQAMDHGGHWVPQLLSSSFHGEWHLPPKHHPMSPRFRSGCSFSRQMQASFKEWSRSLCSSGSLLASVLRQSPPHANPQPLPHCPCQPFNQPWIEFGNSSPTIPEWTTWWSWETIDHTLKDMHVNHVEKMKCCSASLDT